MKLSGVLSIDGMTYKTPIEELVPLGDLGNGTCGHVVKMKHRESGKIIACKQMRRTGNSEETKRIVMDMDVVLKSHDCKEIVVCLGCFITASDVWICMELMATCFDKLLKLLKTPVPEKICGKVAVATLNALNYLKDKHGVIHRDVKPSNILLDYEGRVKLCDFGISGRLVDSKARTRSAGCAAYMAPERINPPNPSKPDYDIRADVWSLGITLVELATGSFPYKDCKTEFEVLTKVIQDDPPCLPLNQGFSHDFRSFVHDCLLKNHKDRPKYKKLLEHPFIVKYRDMEVDVGSWYHSVSHHSGDPNKVQASSDPMPRKTSLEQRPETQSFKPQPSPRMVKSWRTAGHSLPGHEEGKVPQDTSFSRLKYLNNSSHEVRRDSDSHPTSPRLPESQRYENPRLHDMTHAQSRYGVGERFDTRYNIDSSRLNGPLSRNNFVTSSYHGSSAAAYLSRPSYVNSRSHEEAFSNSIKSPPTSRFDKLNSYSETNSPRDYGHTSPSATQRKYSFETLDTGPRDYHFTPKGSRKYDPGLNSDQHSPRKYDQGRLDSPRSLEKSFEAGESHRSVRDGGHVGQETRGSRKYPALPVPEQPRGREQTRESSRNFINPSSWKIGSWTLSSPLNLRKFRTTSSDRTSTFDRNLRLQPGYRSLNERDKHVYSSSGKSDNL